MLYKMMVSSFHHLVITIWKDIYQIWVLFEQVLRGPALPKFSNAVLASNNITRDEAEDQMGLDEL